VRLLPEQRRVDPGLADILIGDGRPLLSLVALGLIASGAFAFFLSAAGELLPQDVAYLGISAAELRRLEDGRVLDFMFHDRVAFGGTLIAIGTLYLWLIAVPLRAREPWAWNVLLASGAAGFASFLAYLGYGYLDSWHAVATVALLLPFAVGLWRTRPGRAARGASQAWRPPLTRPDGLGRGLLLLVGFGMLLAGSVIVTIGSLVVFVPQDLTFIGLDRVQLDAINPRLVPLIAHDRAGFGGALATTGIIIIGTVWSARPSRGLWQALLVAGGVGFGAALAIHALVGYDDLSHVGPAILGAAVFAVAMALYPRNAAVASPAREAVTAVPLR
jgi:hypothetical protein